MKRPTESHQSEGPPGTRSLTCTVPEAAQMLGVSRGSAYEAARTGQLPTVRIGRRLLVSLVALNRLLQGTDVAPISPPQASRSTERACRGTRAQGTGSCCPVS